MSSTARSALLRAVEALESAQNWGTFDLLGGGMLASAVKYGRLDGVGEAVREAEPVLQRFARELADVEEHTALGMETDSLTVFADIFIDNILVDLLVQSRINDLLDAAIGMSERLRGLLNRLEQQQQIGRVSLRLEKERRSLLERI